MQRFGAQRIKTKRKNINEKDTDNTYQDAPYIGLEWPNMIN